MITIPTRSESCTCREDSSLATWYREDSSLSALKGTKPIMDSIFVRGNKKAIGIFVSGSETKQLGWIPKETISEMERMGQVEFKISLITFKEKEISFYFSKIDYMS